ncbi:hypothetical protein [Chlamydia trachomatis]|uniref:hypothetical protein n=1 Tax=Chlamydia trachomatis TaxID=813 RepID=UPI0002F33747|nr:hypothetical protein [Chlamydia trachomatis]
MIHLDSVKKQNGFNKNKAILAELGRIFIIKNKNYHPIIETVLTIRLLTSSPRT